MAFSKCGIDCEKCKFKLSEECKGCRENKGVIFWGECDLYKCLSEKNLDHCAECKNFPCDTLKEWSSSENPERIDNLKKLI